MATNPISRLGAYAHPPKGKGKAPAPSPMPAPSPAMTPALPPMKPKKGKPMPTKPKGW